MTSVKRVKLGVIAKIQPANYANAVAAYQPETDTIYLDVDLPEKNNGTRLAALAHERAHALLHKHGLKQCFPASHEELFCELYALATTPDKALSNMEALARRFMFRGVSWRRKADRHQIIETILILCQVQPNRELVTKLSGMP